MATPTITPLLFEAYFRHSDVNDVRGRLWRWSAPVAIAALLALLQIPFAWRMARTLRADHEQRERLVRQAIGASELERRRIARDLHDGVVQDLSGASLRLAALGRGTSVDPADVTEAAETIRSSVTALRSLLAEITPRELTEDGLEYAIRDLMSGLPARGIETALEVSMADSYVDDRSALLAHRVVQEAIRNALGHARATAVSVALMASNGSLEVRVDDNGRGLASDGRIDDDRAGLELLGDRLAEAGGTLKVVSGAATGTRLTALIALGTATTAS